MDLLNFLFMFAIIGIMAFVIIRFIVISKKNFNTKSKSYIRQEHVQKNISLYACKNEGESLNDSEIFEVPYDAIGY